ncbi:hypothetical protein KC921_04055 [Candidatus Woesebacteria bacterium]|nr:hypothetical protein [Candidatus Woesebacteria bacterium]
MSKNSLKQFQVASAVAILLATLCIVGFFAWKIQVRAIDCRTTDSQPCPDSIAPALYQLVGQRVLFTDLSTQLSDIPEVAQRFTVQKIDKNLLGSITIELQPVSIVYIVNNNGVEYLTTKSGGLVEKNDASDSLGDQCMFELQPENAEDPESNLIEGTGASLRLEPKTHQKILELLDSLEKNNLSCQTITYQTNQRWLLKLASLEKIVVINPEELVTNLDRLSLLLRDDQAIQPDDANQYIDVRFKLPVLRNQL